VPVYVGAADTAEARREVPERAVARDPMRLAPMARFLVHGLTHGGLRSTPIKEVTPIAGATTLDVPGAPAVIPLPGHTPGSVTDHMPSMDAIFMGDAMTTRSVTTGIVRPALALLTVDPAKAVASLDALDGPSANWVLPGHGDPWTSGLPEALRLIRAARPNAQPDQEPAAPPPERPPRERRAGRLPARAHRSPPQTTSSCSIGETAQKSHPFVRRIG
jgi:glyoxylase-like metal-dependent hydrolase (beta-lactamase superfamily II)